MNERKYYREQTDVMNLIGENYQLRNFNFNIEINLVTMEITY